MRPMQRLLFNVLSMSQANREYDRSIRHLFLTSGNHFMNESFTGKTIFRSSITKMLKAIF